MGFDPDFISNVNNVSDNMEYVKEASSLFDGATIELLSELSEYNLNLITDDLYKSNYLGNRKIDIDLALNNESTEVEVTYQGVTITTNTGAVIQINFESSPGIIEELASYTAIYNAIVAGIDDWNANEADPQLHVDGTEIDIINSTLPELPTMIRFRDEDGAASSIDRVQLQVYSGSAIDMNPAYFWAKTTSALQTLANRVGDIIALGNDIDSIILLASKNDEIQYLYDNQTTLQAIYDELTKLLAIESKLVEISGVYDNQVNIDAVFANEVDISTVATNILSIVAVANDIVNINAVAGNKTNIDNVANNESDIDTTALNIDSVNAVANDIANINAVAENKINIDKVVANEADIDTVALNISSVNAVDSNMASIATVSDNIINVNAVVANEADIDTVAANILSVNAVVNDIANVNTVAGNTTNIDAVALNNTDISTVATNLAGILAANQSASSAATSASTALTAAGNASTSATEAQGYVSQITGLTANANTLIPGSAASASYNSGSGLLTIGVPQGLKGDRGDAFNVDASGPIADRSLYDTAGRGFSFLSLDEDPTMVYFKASDTSGDWTVGVAFGKGDKGDKGDTGQEAYTDLELKTKYEANSNTNAFTDLDKNDLEELRIRYHDTNEPSGFNRANPDSMGIIELCVDGNKVISKDGHEVVTSISASTWLDGSAATIRHFRIAPYDGNDIEVYIEGKKHLISSAQEITLPEITGLYFIHFVDIAGVPTLQYGSTFDYDYFVDKPIVATVYGNAVSAELVNFGDERHGITMDGFTHRYLHFTQGTQYISGMGINGLANGTGTFTSIDAGHAYDEDIVILPAAKATAPFMYRSGADWTVTTDDNLIGLIDTGVAQWNENIGDDIAPNFQLSDIVANDRMIMFVFLTNNIEFPYVKILGQTAYPDAATAKADMEDAVNNLQLSGLPSPEFLPIGALLIDLDGNLDEFDTGVPYIDLRTASIGANGGVSGTTNLHANLTDTDTDGHPISAITDLQTTLDSKQATLVSGTNIKTINSTPILGSGDLVIESGIGEYIDNSIAISSDGSALSNDDGTANNNIGIGTQACLNLTSGLGTVAISRRAGFNLTDGNFSTFIGYNSGYNATTSDYNIAVGAESLYGDSTDKLTGSYNTGIGYQTGYSLTTGQHNVLNGYKAGYNLTSGSDSVMIGREAGYSSIYGNSVCIGREAGKNSTTTIVAIGYTAGYNATIGSGGTFVGSSAGYNSTGTSIYNSCFGESSGSSITSGDYNTSVGSGAGRYKYAGSGGTEVGYDAGRFSQGSGNTAIGREALYGDSTDKLTGSYNTGIGYQTGYSLTTGQYNVLNGYQAGYGLTTGSENVLIGKSSGKSLTTTYGNVFVGSTTGVNATGYQNTLVGEDAGTGLTTGGQNVILGNLAKGGSGSNNVVIGEKACYNMGSAGNNVLVGRYVAASVVSGNNNIVMGNGADASADISNEITLGDSAITSLRCAVTTITALSDERDKDNIQDLDTGLDFINSLRPVRFDWNMRDGGKVGENDIGFIAQELQQAQVDNDTNINHLVMDNNPDKLEAGYGMLIAPMVQAIKELKAELDTVKAEINQLKGN